jgi:methylaspartate mutase sigma subunit
MAKGKGKLKLVLGVIGSDVHAVGNKILENILVEEGFKVTNIGVLSSQEDFINAAIETAADLIVVSSLYGHGEIDCRGMREKCIEAGIGDIPLYVGGNLVVGKKDFNEVKKTFEEEMGFTRAYPPGTSPQQLIDDIKKDFNI